MEVLLWATEAVSGVYGLGLNRDKCVKISVKAVADMVFSNDEKVPEEDRVEYLGAVVNARTDPKLEINRRIAAARYIWTKLKLFWRGGLLSVRDKTRIYDTLIASKLTYGLHTLPLKDDLLAKIDAFHFKGLRQMLKMKPPPWTEQTQISRFCRLRRKRRTNGTKSQGKRKPMYKSLECLRGLRD